MYKNYLSIIIGKVISLLFKMTGRINNLPLYVHFHNANYKYENLLDIVLLNYRSLHQYLSLASLLYVFEFLFFFNLHFFKTVSQIFIFHFICWFSSSSSARCCFNSPNCLYKCPICSSILETDAKISFFSTSTHLINLWFDSKRPLYSLTHLTYILLSVPCLLVPLELIFLKYLIR